MSKVVKQAILIAGLALASTAGTILGVVAYKAFQAGDVGLAVPPCLCALATCYLIVRGLQKLISGQAS